jgi:TPR repeat protein
MRISSGVLAALLLAAASGAAVCSDGVKYASPRAAFEQGLGAYKSGYYEIAIPALEHAARNGPELNRFFAEFYLARIFSDNAGALTDHRRAYMLFQKLADEYADVDPDDGRRAPFVAKALTALAGYLRNGVREVGVEPDPERAVEYLHHAATFFGDHDAQFELARIYLTERSNPEDVKRAKHYLSVLAEEGHAGAQAFLADLYWRGRHVKKDENRALALITVAVENAPPHERIWIEDIYQNIFCGTSQGTRQQADGVVAKWRKFFVRPAAPSDRMGLGVREIEPQRTCGNGEVVEIRRGGGSSLTKEAPAVMAAPPAARPPEAMHGSTTGFGFRDAGTTK